MTENPIKLAVIIGSVRGGRFGPTVANWFVEQAKKHGDFTVDLIDLAEFPLPVQMPAFGEDPDPETNAIQERLSARLHEADAFAVVTPEYNHTFPSSLKNAIDWFFDEWMAKPVGLISYGGMGGGLRASEHLRQVFAEVHATTVRDMLSFHNAWSDFEQEGRPASPAGSEDAAGNLLNQLAWWAEGLREARDKRPYKR
ncbi:NAD(P)H-dependent oxidoreductase [Streptomyces thinghirensis]|uniref:NAD(P)H-dependent oxidoreductase n=1 Tax=Streptomyces thinghirensis TaxID=551547 RepID=A0ABP9TG63_9ACTN|nr:NAD(P)H-dependent oxidoreductase [Streptomyces sp. E2N166]MCF2436244.1 NAD(P)H-dependent oxidoreductase [Streptomyces thinghirensis]